MSKKPLYKPFTLSNLLSSCCNFPVIDGGFCGKCLEHCETYCTICLEEDCDGEKYHKNKYYKI